MSVNPFDREQGKFNYDHFMQFLIIDSNGKCRCSNCFEEITSTKQQILALKGIDYCKEMIRLGKNGKSDVK